MGNPEKLATLGTQDTRQINVREYRIKNGQSRETGNIGYTRHRTKSNKIKNKTQKAKKNEQHGHYQKLEVNPCVHNT
jgi:hypothetical protein